MGSIFKRAVFLTMFWWLHTGMVFASNFIGLSPGWNLVANSKTTPIITNSQLNGSAKITSVWKWNTLDQKWAFYSPFMTSDQLTAFAQSNRYDVLNSISPKEGFWVNAAGTGSLANFIEPPDVNATVVSLTAQDLVPGWNLVGSADHQTACQIHGRLNDSLNAAGKTIKSVWAWNATSAQWHLYAPSLENTGGTVAADDIPNLSYLPLNVAMPSTEGFWVNVGVVVPALPVVTRRVGALRPLPAEFTTRKAVNYGPYRTSKNKGHPCQTEVTTAPLDVTKTITRIVLGENGQCVLDPTDIANEVITDEMIAQDMHLLSLAGFGLIRLFDSSMKLAERTLRVIKTNNLDIKVMLGAFVDDYPPSPVDPSCVLPSSSVESKAEIARTVVLANAYPDIVLAVSVGNETMVSWSTAPVSSAKMAAYIAKVRSQISQPVTSDDNWAFYANQPNMPYDTDVILNAVDFVSMHTYPELDTIYNPTLWDWRQFQVAESARAQAMMNAAIVSAKNEYFAVRTYLDAKNLSAMPIVIGETGWNAVNTGKLPFLAHPVNQKMYLDKLLAWANEGRTGAGPKAVFYFEAFDEPWKQGDDKWGLFNVDRQARYALAGVQPTGNVAWVNEPATYTDADAVHWVMPTVHVPVDATQYARYKVYADAVATADVFVDSALGWWPWDSTMVGNANFAGTGDGPYALEIKPTPAQWGWGMSFGDVAPANLSEFAAGHVQFDIKTTYPGTIEVGLRTTTQDSQIVEVFLALKSGDYGYCNTNTWCHVSIPLADLVKGSNADLTMLVDRFVIADRFDITGKGTGTAELPPVYIDNIYISRD